MKKIILVLLISFLSNVYVFAELSPEYMYSLINNSQIKAPAKIIGIKTLQSKKGYKIQLVKFEGLYNKKGEYFEAKCHNFETESPYTNMYKEPRKYVPKRGANVYVTIDKNGGEITSMVNMDKVFEQKLQTTPDKIKYDCYGAYFEEK